MNLARLVIPILLLVAALAVACGEAATPTPTPATPTATPTPTSTPVPSTPTPSPTPTSTVVMAPIESVQMELSSSEPTRAGLVVVSGLRDSCRSFDRYEVNRLGETKIVVQIANLRVTGPDVACAEIYRTVTTTIPLEGKFQACQVYPVQVNVETYQVQAISPNIRCSDPSTPSPDPTPTAQPQWLKDLLTRLKAGSEADPPLLIASYQYQGETVYYVRPGCCDRFSIVYDADGNVMGHPDGGITGNGDGSLPGFFDEATNEVVLWDATTDPGTAGSRSVPAPIESIELKGNADQPGDYSLVVVSGLPNSCYSFEDYQLERSGADGDTFYLTVTNLRPADTRMMCAMVYGFVETVIPVEGDIEPCRTYQVVANEEPFDVTAMPLSGRC